MVYILLLTASPMISITVHCHVVEVAFKVGDRGRHRLG